MSSASLVSVIVPVYNGERFLAETLQSLLAQDYPHFEAIIVDDGSSDRSSDILRRFPDARMTVLRQPNGGSASAVAKGLSVAAGTYCAFLDQDDLWTPDKLRRHVDVMDANAQVDLTFSWFTVVNERGQPMGIHSARVHGVVSFQSLIADFVIGGTSNVVVRRDAVLQAGGPDPAIPGMFDLDLFARIALLRSGNTLSIPLELTSYRRHPGQMTRNIRVLEKEWRFTLEKLLRMAPTDLVPVARRGNANMKRYFARLSYEEGQFRQGLGFLAQGFRLNPLVFATDSRNWLTVAACVAGCVLPAAILRAAEQLAGLRRS